jgi:hypothetical protein
MCLPLHLTYELSANMMSQKLLVIQAAMLFHVAVREVYHEP